MNKKEKFEYFLNCLYEKTDDQNITMVRAQKLLFLTTVASTTLSNEYSLLKDFNFQAWSYGAVDEEIYNEFKDKLDKPKINTNENKQYKNQIEKCINRLVELNNNILSLHVYDLIGIAQRYNSWKYNFNIGNKTPISERQIKLDSKTFSL